MAFSATKISCWARCPRAYYFQHIQGKEPTQTKPMFIGTKLHRLHKDFFDLRLYEEGRLSSYIEKNIPALLNNENNLKVLDIDKEELKKDLIRAVNLLKEKFDEGKIYKPVYIEDKRKKLEYDDLEATPDFICEINNKITIGDIKPEEKPSFETKLQIATSAVIYEQHKLCSLQHKAL